MCSSNRGAAGHHYFGPEIGRYIFHDPIDFGDDDLNVYLYSHNNTVET